MPDLRAVPRTSEGTECRTKPENLNRRRREEITDTLIPRFVSQWAATQESMYKKYIKLILPDVDNMHVDLLMKLSFLSGSCIPIYIEVI